MAWGSVCFTCPIIDSIVFYEKCHQLAQLNQHKKCITFLFSQSSHNMDGDIRTIYLLYQPYLCSRHYKIYLQNFQACNLGVIHRDVKSSNYTCQTFFVYSACTLCRVNCMKTCKRSWNDTNVQKNTRLSINLVDFCTLVQGLVMFNHNQSSAVKIKGFST